MPRDEKSGRYVPSRSARLFDLSWNIELAQRSINKQEEVLDYSKKQLADLEEEYNKLKEEIDNG